MYHHVYVHTCICIYCMSLLKGSTAMLIIPVHKCISICPRISPSKGRYKHIIGIAQISNSFPYFSNRPVYGSIGKQTALPYNPNPANRKSRKRLLLHDVVPITKPLRKPSSTNNMNQPISYCFLLSVRNNKEQ